MRNYKDLQVWAKAHALTLRLYRITKTFPKDELYGLTGQLRRASSSIGANLAEGCGRRTNAEFARFVRIALGSASELDYHLLLCRDLGLVTNEDFEIVTRDLTSVRKMLTALLNTVEVDVAHKSRSAAANG